MSILLSFLLLGLSAWAKTYEHQLDGTYFLSDPQTLVNIPVNYRVTWNEDNQRIKGVYQDNQNKNAVVVSGSVDPLGTHIHGYFPEAKSGYYFFTLKIINSVGSTESVPVTVTLRDRTGARSISLISSGVLQNKETCENSFGALNGFCGSYFGRTNEIQDPFTLCDLTAFPLRLSLGSNAKITLSSDAGTHYLGSLPSNQTNGDIEMSSRNCGLLAGTKFPSEGCQSLRLSGTFTDTSGIKTFRGTYTIQDETLGRSCSYQLDLRLVRE